MGEIESRKEFITRMYLLSQELPSETLQDANNVLSFLEFQLKVRESDLLDEVSGKIVNVLSRSNSISSRNKSWVIKELEALKGTQKYVIHSEKENNP